MKPERTVTHIEAPYEWSHVTNGQWAAQLLQQRLDEWSPKLFGYHMLKLGGLSAELTSNHCNIKHQVSVDKYNRYRTVEADPFYLPFIEKSFDACLLIHQLDYSADPYRLLREIDRVIVDDGYLLISGNNPLSIMGLRGLLPWNQTKPPWTGRMFLPMRINDWLCVLNYEVIHHETFAILPATKHLSCATWLENVLSDTFSGAGSLYFIVARKRTCPLRPIKPQWKIRRQFTPLGVNYRTKSDIE